MKSLSLLQQGCSQGLPGTPHISLIGIDDLEWRDLIDSAVAERTVALLASAARTGLIELTTEQRAELSDRHEQAMRVCVALERVTLEVHAAFAAAGIDARLLKGSAVAHLDYPDPAFRAFGDIDLLVPSSSYEEAVKILELSGATRRFSEVRPGFDRQFGKGVCMLRPDDIQVDLHRTFVAGPFGLAIHLDELFDDFAVVELGGVDVPVLTREHRFLHACYHAALGDESPRTVALRDVAQLLLCSDLDLTEARHTARRWRSEAVVARAIGLAWSKFGLGDDPAIEWARSYRPNKFESRSIAAYVGPHRSYARQMTAGAYAVRGIAEKIVYVRTLLAVSPEYARIHDGGYRQRLWRAWTSRPRRERAT